MQPKSTFVVFFSRTAGILLASTIACGPPTDGGPDAPEPDLVEIAGVYRMSSVTNDEAYRPAVSWIPRPADLIEAYTVENRYRVQVDGGLFSFAIPAEAERYRVVVPDYFSEPLEIQHSARTLTLSDPFAIRPGCGFATVPVLIDTPNDDGEAVGNDFVLASTGWWSWQPPGTGGTGPVEQSWSGCLLSRAQRDRLYYLRMNNTGLGTMIDRVLTADVDMVEGVTTQISGRMTTLASDQCIHLLGKRADETKRAASVLEGYETVENPYGDWAVVAVADRRLGPVVDNTILLASRSNPHRPAPPAVNFDDQALYADPFGGDRVASVAVSLRRTFRLPGAEPSFDQYAGLVTYREIAGAPGCDFASFDTQLGIPIPSSISLDGVQLDADDLTFAHPAAQQPMHLTFELSPGSVEPDLYEITILTIEQFTLGGHVRTGVRPLRRIWSTTREVVLPRTLVSADGFYAFQITARKGVPNAKDGDFQTIVYPYAEGTSYSNMFRIQ